MADQDHQKGEEKQDASQQSAGPTKLVDKSRRSFTKSGLVASGVLLTLASRPVLGGGGGWMGDKGDGKVGGWACNSPSGFLSGNLSFHGTPPTCLGRTPGYWSTHDWISPYKTGSCIDRQHKQDYKSWSNSGSSSGTMYNDSTLGFDCFAYGLKYKEYSMMQVVLLGGVGDTFQLGAHCVAALLNARMGWTPVLTEAQIRNMFNEYAAKGYFEPTAGVKWYPEDIVTYLKSTMTL